ncbi:VIT family protein [uncultured archaeon]|nr:VIT family protein [uncultured archaeon]
MPRRPKPHPGESIEKESNIREIIFGAEDGFVSTLGLVLGMASATNDSKVVIIAGAVYVIAEAFSMAAGTYLSSKAEKQFYQSKMERERWEINHIPAAERQEIRDIYRKRGFKGRMLDGIVSRITSDKRLWLKMMMEEELHIFPSSIDPARDGAAMFLTSIAAGLVPLLPFVLLPPANSVAVSVALTLAALFLTGALKGRFVAMDWKRSGLEMLVVGALAAAIGYGVGFVTGGLVH